MARKNLDHKDIDPTGRDEVPPTSEMFASAEKGKSPGAGMEREPDAKEAETESKPDGPRRPRAKKAKVDEPTEPLPYEAQPAPELPKAKRTKTDYNIDDIIADDSDEDEYSEPAPTIPKLADKLPKAKYLQIRGGKDAQTQLYAIKLDEEDQRPGELNSYVLTKKMRDYFINELNYKVTKMNVCDVCALQGQQFMYLYPATSELSNNSWNISRTRMLVAATRGWIIVSTDMEKREYTYRSRKASLPFVKAVYPTEPISKRAVQALHGPRLIDSPDHPIVKRLLGEVEDDGEQ